jgi:hypothetical protein
MPKDGRLVDSELSGVHVIDIGGCLFMAVSRGAGPDMRIYKWNDKLSKFEHTQNFAVTSHWFDPQFFTIGVGTFRLR